MVPLFGAAYAAPNKGTTILYCFRPPKTVLNPLANGKIQGLLKASECFSSTLQGKFYFQGCSSTFQACANPEDCSLRHLALYVISMFEIFSESE